MVDESDTLVKLAHVAPFADPLKYSAARSGNKFLAVQDDFGDR